MGATVELGIKPEAELYVSKKRPSALPAAFNFEKTDKGVPVNDMPRTSSSGRPSVKTL